ncbi:MAG: tRNA (adenosine(37)-N6)-threonylcarbamoyltransferase complex ATPase subunit type 1 TsaE [Campylobacterota bacterium]|nr:tRNA (adenosine(37)-N6)-threonylcarbamoyltransferase complex ATPase subunit type 1 TsaE [Campylobacterota bacterium]
MEKFVLKLNQIEQLTKHIHSFFKNGVVILKGDLASGKTTFVRVMTMRLCIDDEVTSPTFSLQHCYSDKVFHYDIYNHGLEHFISLGMLEELDKPGIHFVEWGDDELVEILKSAEIPTITIEIKKIADDAREYIVCTH